MRNLILVAGLLFGMAAQPSHAQTPENRNAISARLHFFDYGLFADETSSNSTFSQGFEVGYFRNLLPFLNVGVPVKLGIAKLPATTNNTVTVSGDLLIQLQQMKETSRFSPFLFGGVGMVTEALKAHHINVPVGVGLNFRISNFAFISPQLEFRKALIKNRDHVSLGLGFVYLLHPAPPNPADTIVVKPVDSDGDGILDYTDACPDEIGKAETFGCPDRDADGVSDKEDKCPDAPGKPGTLGCPDSDNDGFADKMDDCPDKPGKVNGCPDSDNDGFADKDDECPTLAGRWNGCPDTDFDGVPDKDDECPKDPGPAASKGCPASAKDLDKDGFADEKDECPTAAGTIRGCPDKDGDGFADKDDACPDAAGNLKGCPDKDGDNFPDGVDKCPDLAGPINGCPDRDNDGWADADDKCPDLAGKVDGCPEEIVKDSDNDGTPDKTDPCPTIAGKMNGCPDSDADGLADNLDKCPNSAGPAANNGCPEVKKEVKERLAFATKNVQFESGKAVLKTNSYHILEEVADILKAHPDYKLLISGHTDDQGIDAANLILSTERAKACHDFLLFKGIPAERMRSAGFGEQRPIASNVNEAGRELNRRVDFELTLD